MLLLPAVQPGAEHGEIPNRMRILQVDSDSPDILRFERRLMADQFALIPGFAFLDGFHDRLFGC